LAGHLVTGPVRPDQVRAAADKAAEDDHRSVASLAEMALVALLKERGYLPK